jgi:hypothetical protein
VGCEARVWNRRLLVTSCCEVVMAVVAAVAAAAAAVLKPHSLHAQQTGRNPSCWMSLIMAA